MLSKPDLILSYVLVGAAAFLFGGAVTVLPAILAGLSQFAIDHILMC